MRDTLVLYDEVREKVGHACGDGGAEPAAHAPKSFFLLFFRIRAEFKYQV